MATINMDPHDFIAVIDGVLPGATLSVASGTTATYTLGSQRVTLTRTGLSASGQELAGGTVTSMTYEVFDNGTLLWLPIGVLSGLSLASTALDAAVDKEQAGTDLAALEVLMGAVGYAFVGGSRNDSLQPIQSNDGITVRLTASNFFDGGAGNDVLTGGSARHAAGGLGAGGDLRGRRRRPDRRGGQRRGRALRRGRERRHHLRGAGDLAFGGDGNDILRAESHVGA